MLPCRQTRPLDESTMLVATWLGIPKYCEQLVLTIFQEFHIRAWRQNDHWKIFGVG